MEPTDPDQAVAILRKGPWYHAPELWRFSGFLTLFMREFNPLMLHSRFVELSFL